MNAMAVASTSEREWTASEIIAAELPKMPANSLNADRATFPLTPTAASFAAIRLVSFSDKLALPSGLLFFEL